MAEEGTASLSESDNADTNTNGKKFVVGEHSVYDSVEALFEGAKQKEKYIAELIKANKELQEKINAALKKIKENGEYDKIYAKWFGEKK